MNWILHLVPFQNTLFSLLVVGSNCTILGSRRPLTSKCQNECNLIWPRGGGTLCPPVTYLCIAMRTSALKKLDFSQLWVCKSHIQGVPQKTHFQNHHCGPSIHPSPQAWLAGSKQPQWISLTSDVSACRMMILKVRFFVTPCSYLVSLKKIMANDLICFLFWRPYINLAYLAVFV